MPELPEVETVCRGLASTIAGKKLTKVQNFRNDLRTPFPAGFSGKLEGRTIEGISRRAKYILIHLDNGTSLIAHLGMSGRMVVHNSPRPGRNKHDHVIFHTDDGKEVVFNDPRRFGMMDITKSAAINEHKAIKDLGIEPLEDVFNGAALHKLLAGRKIPVKLAIMNANLVVGVGNIYACEALFMSSISPVRPAKEVSTKECGKLSMAIKDVLNAAIKAGGSTLRDYVASSGESGYFQHNFKAYGRENEPCIACGTSIKRIVQGGRSTFFCPKCQPS